MQWNEKIEYKNVNSLQIKGQIIIQNLNYNENFYSNFC